MNYLLFNSKSASGEGEKEARQAGKKLEGEFGPLHYLDLVSLQKPAFFASLGKEDKVIVSGGDGTLNRLVNDLGDVDIPDELYLLSLGTGNDFLNDVKATQLNNGLVPLGRYLKRLPIVETMGIKRRFVNGIGFGIDGDCCVKAEEMKTQGKTEINYGNITVKLLLTSYKAPEAEVKIDGEEFHFKKVYIAAGMNGRYYGGGMEVAPMQVRGDGELTFVCVHKLGKLRTLLLFPSLFKGEHIKKKNAVFAKRGKTIEVSFSRPTGLQIDGEIVPNAASYKIYFPEDKQ